MRVTAQGLDGRTVNFTVERQAAGKWEPLATVSAVVAGGAATAKVVVRQPALAGAAPKLSELQAAAPLQIRFHAELA